MEPILVQMALERLLRFNNRHNQYVEQDAVANRGRRLYRTVFRQLNHQTTVKFALRPRWLC